MVYSQAPQQRFEEIAILNASSKSMFNAGGQGSTDKHRKSARHLRATSHRNTAELSWRPRGRPTSPIAA